MSQKETAGNAIGNQSKCRLRAETLLITRYTLTPRFFLNGLPVTL